MIELRGIHAAAAQSDRTVLEDHVAVHKVRTNRPLTPTDLEELECILVESGVGTSADVHRAAESNQGLGLFVRSLVGLDRGAAKEAFAAFLRGKTLTANQIGFVNLIVDHLTENGAMDPALLYSSPYTDFSPRGVDGVFGAPDAAEIVDFEIGVEDGGRVVPPW